jgi:hypothetical protein
MGARHYRCMAQSINTSSATPRACKEGKITRDHGSVEFMETILAMIGSVTLPRGSSLPANIASCSHLQREKVGKTPA